MLWATATMAFFVAAALDEPAVLGGEVGVAFADSAAGTLDQGLAQGAVGQAGAAAQPLARALMVARAEAGPGGRVARGREPRHVAAEFGRDHLGRAAGDAGDRVELGERFGVRRGERLDLAIARGDGAVEELDVAQEVIGRGPPDRPLRAAGALGTYVTGLLLAVAVLRG